MRRCISLRHHGLGPCETGRDAVKFRCRDQLRLPVNILVQDGLELGIHLIDESLPLSLDQDLDACLVGVVAPPEAVVDADDRFQVNEDLLPRYEGVDLAGDEGCAAHAPAHQHPKAHFAQGVAVQFQPDVVPGDGGAVFAGAAHGDLELARQEGELGVQGAPLPKNFAVGAGVYHLVGSHAGQCIAGDVADAIAAGLDAVHVHFGQQVHHIGRAVQCDPVELQVLPRGEVAPAAVEFIGDAGQLAQLRAADGSVGHGHPQHRRVALHIPAVLQAQGSEFLVA